MFVLAGVPVVVLGLVTLSLIDRSHRHDVSLIEQQLIGQKVEEVGKFLANTINILELRIGFPERTEIVLLDQEFLLDEFLKENRSFEEVSFVSLDGQETSRKVRSGAQVALRDVSQSPYFQEVLRGHRFIGESFHSSSGSFFTIAAPARNRNGYIIQVLAATVNLADIVNSIQQSRLGTSGYLVLVDRNGNLIAEGSGVSLDPGTDLSSGVRVSQVLREGPLMVLEKKIATKAR